MSIRKTARKLKRKYGTCDPFELSKCLDIIVLVTDLDQSVRGYFHYFQRNKIIYLNNLLNEFQRRYVLAHELGHAMLHIKSNSLFLQSSTFFVGEKFEKEADLFAAELLLPNCLKDTYPEYYTLEQIANAENVPIELIQLKLYT